MVDEKSFEFVDNVLEQLKDSPIWHNAYQEEKVYFSELFKCKVHGSLEENPDGPCYWRNQREQALNNIASHAEWFAYNVHCEMVFEFEIS